MKEKAGWKLKVWVVPENQTPKRWLCGRGILEQLCHRGRTAGLSHFASGGRRWASGAVKELCKEAIFSADSHRAVLSSEAGGCCFFWAPLFICLQRVFEILLYEVLCKYVFKNPPQFNGNKKKLLCFCIC